MMMETELSTTTTMTTTTSLYDDAGALARMPPLYQKALCTAIFLSFFMSCTTYLILPLPSESIHSTEQVQLVEQGMKDLLDLISAPSSVRIMTNFSWPNGLPVTDAWTSLR
jgi:hypothetical protein